MRYSIKQVDPTTWELRGADRDAKSYTVLARYTDAGGRTGYDLAADEIRTKVREQLAGNPRMLDQGSGVLLPESWVSVDGICFNKALPGGRDFTKCEWSWRDPEMTTSPLLLLDSETDYGHLGAELCGFTQEFTQGDGSVSARGRFYNTDVGIQARDMLLAAEEADIAGVGVSIGPTENVEVNYDESEKCTSWDDDGFCDGYEYDLTIEFLKYEIGSLCIVPVAGFESGVITVDRSGDQPLTARPKLRASATIPTKPPLEWLHVAEPKPGVPFRGALSGDDVLIEQTDRRGNIEGFACPITFAEGDDYGLIYGHLTYWGQCHTGDPWGRGVCASAEPSADGYAFFNSKAGAVECADGTVVPAGKLVVGCEHSSAMSVEGVQDHLAHAGLAWASARVVDGEFGPWLCGVLDPGLTDGQVAELRRLSLSGEWVGELGGILSVNASGFPVQRERLAASFGAGEKFDVPTAALRASFNGGAVTKLIGGNIVRRCRECDKRKLAAAATPNANAEIMSMLRRLDARTAHLIPEAAERAQQRLAASARRA